MNEANCSGPTGSTTLAACSSMKAFVFCSAPLTASCFGLLRQFLARRFFQGVDQLLFILEHAHAEFLLRRDERVPGQAAVVHARLDLVQQFDDVLLGHVLGDARGIMN